MLRVPFSILEKLWKQVYMSSSALKALNDPTSQSDVYRVRFKAFVLRPSHATRAWYARLSASSVTTLLRRGGTIDKDTIHQEERFQGYTFGTGFARRERKGRLLWLLFHERPSMLLLLLDCWPECWWSIWDDLVCRRIPIFCEFEGEEVDMVFLGWDCTGCGLEVPGNIGRATPPAARAAGCSAGGCVGRGRISGRMALLLPVCRAGREWIGVWSFCGGVIEAMRVVGLDGLRGGA
ncbi:hypothetical protein Tco_1166574 [Tanacetum coccineum]